MRKKSPATSRRLSRKKTTETGTRLETRPVRSGETTERAIQRSLSAEKPSDRLNNVQFSLKSSAFTADSSQLTSEKTRQARHWRKLAEPNANVVKHEDGRNGDGSFASRRIRARARRTCSRTPSGGHYKRSGGRRSKLLVVKEVRRGYVAFAITGARVGQHTSTCSPC